MVECRRRVGCLFGGAGASAGWVISDSRPVCSDGVCKLLLEWVWCVYPPFPPLFFDVPGMARFVVPCPCLFFILTCAVHVL